MSIRALIMHYGHFAALKVLREEQDKENYENCSLIYKSLKQIQEVIDWELDTRVDDISLDNSLNRILDEGNHSHVFELTIKGSVIDFRNKFMESKDYVDTTIR